MCRPSGECGGRSGPIDRAQGWGLLFHASYLSRPRSPGARARNRRREYLLAPAARIVPEGMNKVVICSQPLIVPNELQTTLVHWSIYRRIPALRGHANILEKRLTMVDGLCEIDINELVLGIKACIEEQDADNAIGSDG